jgi:hypothetical protein
MFLSTEEFAALLKGGWRSARVGFAVLLLWATTAAAAGADYGGALRSMPGASPEALGDVDRAERLKDAANQAYDAGRIDAAERDRITDRAEQSLKDAFTREADRLSAFETQRLGDELDAMTDRVAKGDIADAKAFQDMAQEALALERQNQLLGRESKLGEKVTRMFETYYKALLARCDTQKLDPVMVLGMERQAQLLGVSTDPAALDRCLPHVYDAGDGYYKSRDSGPQKIWGVVNDLTKPFTLQAEAQGANSVNYHYAPTGASGGTSKHAWTGPGFSGGGAGKYAIEKRGDAYFVTDRAHGCGVHNIPITCNDYVITFKLTPRPVIPGQ